MSKPAAKATARARYLRSAKGKPTKVKLGGNAVPKRTRQVPGATLRCIDLEKYLRDRYGPVLPDDDAGRADAEIMLNHIFYRQAVDRPWLMNDWLDRCAPWLIGEERETLIAKVFRKPRKYTADRLAKELGLTYARRQRLGITTIGSIDVDAEQRKELQKVKKREHKAQKRRDAGCMTRSEYEGNSIARIAPWEALGLSRATYYRRQQQAASEAKSHYAGDGLVSSISYAIVTVRAL
ncbi:hypothetical protein [Bradyrhizobium genosp. A]|uniref:hypothetical protein n=1 Tax=Bradyrhizobium genosp. A TaxID=83626 RepID=UPI003CEB3D79